ncbi:hypothetical protein F2Q69_00047882 [Brassica cretica]|uniref:Uncharacterized protein n=1 Tax=Brassica cretica TaxID=69181 RepID=A0A8S9Q1T9_BRACR|nr:hypothetical protein F2Q69_00047882 [Brassica cretica]
MVWKQQGPLVPDALLSILANFLAMFFGCFSVFLVCNSDLGHVKLMHAHWFIFLGCVFMAIVLLVAPVIYAALVYDANQEEQPRRHNHEILLVGF